MFSDTPTGTKVPDNVGPTQYRSYRYVPTRCDATPQRSVERMMQLQLSQSCIILPLPLMLRSLGSGATHVNAWKK
eukprot:scaffold116720_cov49-Attheya_sp.AAC.2